MGLTTATAAKILGAARTTSRRLNLTTTFGRLTVDAIRLSDDGDALVIAGNAAAPLSVIALDAILWMSVHGHNAAKGLDAVAAPQGDEEGGE